MIYRDERDKLRREWVGRLIERLHSREASEHEMESFGSTTWNEAFDQGVEWALNHHPEVMEMDKLIDVLESEIDQVLKCDRCKK